MVTTEMLRYCNVLREKQEVHGGGTSNMLRKRTGTGGYGGRILSTEHRIRLGTVGFKGKRGRKSEANMWARQSTDAMKSHFDAGGSTAAETGGFRVPQRRETDLISGPPLG